MDKFQVGVRVPERLHEKLVASAKQADTSKSEIILCALAQYLGDTEDIPITQRVAKLEQRMSDLESEVANKAEEN